MHQQGQELICYVSVRGEGSDPDDEGLPGIYAVAVETLEQVDLDNLTSDQEDKISQAVLDAFHDDNGIAEVDDFAISIYLENGKEISEAEKRVDSAFRVSANCWGSVDEESLPEAVVAALAA